MLVAVILLFAAICSRLLVGEFSALLARIPSEPSEQYKTLVALFAIAASTLTAVIGIAVAIWTYWRTSAKAQSDRRKQHTITILFETRMSDHFQSLHPERAACFPEYTDITYKQWRRVRETRRGSADAVTKLLNYYEFLAVGLDQGDLDEMLLDQTVRGIMCNLVDDAKWLIARLRMVHPQIYKNLADLYEDWRDTSGTARDINGNPNERAIPDMKAWLDQHPRFRDAVHRKATAPT
ncbi:DUF4760 domain-containing protein [Roseovarius sp.]|uniref:DUF4760 domain-containing protein n=1 Tax=Roseovarius sp. TaxID=1486281 RepID=UPI003BAD4BE7